MSRISDALLVVGRMTTFTKKRYFGGTVMWAAFIITPIVTGLVLKSLFDVISGQKAATLENAIWLCAAFVAVETVRGGLLWLALNFFWPYWWNGASTILQTNLLRSILTARGPAASRLPHSSGEAVSRFRDDVHDLVVLADNLVDLVSAFAFAVIAFMIMLAISPVITLALVLPMIVVIILTRLLSDVIRRIHSRARALGAAVTAYIGEIFSGVLAIKTAGAEDAVLERLRAHNRARREAAVKDRLAMDLLDTATGASVEISIGLILLLAAPAMRQGTFTVGDLALFTSYVGWLTFLPRMMGRMLYRVPQAAVATERLSRLMASHESVDDMSKHGPLWFGQEAPPASLPVPTRSDPLHVLEASGLTVVHGDTGRGIREVSLRIPQGSFTVVTGAVGAGKTTLVRALLGLLPVSAGEVRWNGSVVDDPGTFMVPDRVAYAGQVPRLFSESLRENLLLGWPASDADLGRAVELATFEQDLADMPEGLSTVVGPRGVRLSGGQVQRATAARALVRTPDLLVVDDLSSALDVETEHQLWDRIATAASVGRGPSTLLVVSHRRAALERADQVVVLDRGEVVGSGPLDHLLRTCPEMRRLWSEESIVEAEEEQPAQTRV
ncbi:ABC transporter ATP-binding protein [Tenggerimyces flavus]|uniref:ABC transporter ATP-binding protein n=1 Tax=Tenggerimyces flavus TaxID=1708749 RepID=A0ABV7YHG2_9ACTN|nr:ABC transporter ATP-binding protein [Tenggerimyces flavus]MBM7789908.1 ATP-binding cassette subfamily B protein [Tenggerimyces flavus]